VSTGIALLLVLPAALWLIFAVANGGSIRHWDLDVNGVAMTFLGLYDRYCQAYRWLTVLAFAGAVWKRGEASSLFFAVSGIEALLFQVLLLFFFERYLHWKYPRPTPAEITGRVVRPGAQGYSAVQYGLVLVLGGTSLLYFACGVIVAVVGG